MKFACTRRNARATDRVALQAALFEHPPRSQLVLGVLEDAAERAPIRRLGRLSLREQLGHVGLHLTGGARLECEAGVRDDLTGAEIRVAI